MNNQPELKEVIKKAYKAGSYFGEFPIRHHSEESGEKNKFIVELLEENAALKSDLHYANDTVGNYLKEIRVLETESLENIGYVIAGKKMMKEEYERYCTIIKTGGV